MNKEAVQEIIQFRQRNDIIKRFDKLPFSCQTLVNSKMLGAMSVVLDAPIYWQELEKFISEYENPQLPMFPILSVQANKVLEKYYPIGLDKGMRLVE